MKTTYIQKGDNLDYINATDQIISAGDVIMLGKHIGIAGTEIPVKGMGSIFVTGVFALPKVSVNEIAAGTDVYWDGTGITEVSENNTIAGYAVAVSAAATQSIAVKIG